MQNPHCNIPKTQRTEPYIHYHVEAYTAKELKDNQILNYKKKYPLRSYLSTPFFRTAHAKSLNTHSPIQFLNPLYPSDYEVKQTNKKKTKVSWYDKLL